MFTSPKRPIVYLIIPNNATHVVCSCAKTVHKLRWHYFNLHKAAKHGYCAFIIDAIKDTWIYGSWQAKTIYSNITTKAFMDHIQLRCGGLHTLNVVELTSNILTYYGDAVGLSEYINMLKDYQKKAQREQLPIPVITLMAIATKPFI